MDGTGTVIYNDALKLKPLGLLVALWRDFIGFARWNALSLIALTLIVAALEGAGLMLLAPMLEVVGVNGSVDGRGSHLLSAFTSIGLMPSLKNVLFVYMSLIAVHSVLSWRLSSLTSELESSFVDRLRQNLFDDIGATEWAFQASIHSAEFSHALTVDIARTQSGIYSLLTIITVGVMTFAYVATALYLSAILTVITLAAGCVLLFFLRRRHQNSFELGHGLTKSTERVHQDIGEYLAGLKLAKSGNVEARLSRRFADGLQEARKYTVEFSRKHAASLGIFRVGGAALLCVFVYVALAILMVPVATVLTLAFIFTRLLPNLSQVQQGYEQVLNALPAYQAYLAMSDRCRRAIEPPTDRKPYPFTKEIQFRNVGYRPKNSGGDVVTELNLLIPAYSTTALVGASGAGKSTVADLLAGLLTPTEGSILIDGRILDDRRAWREHLAYVPQETFLFNTSVRENLLWTTPDASDAMLWEALDQAAAADFVRALPRGLDTTLGERGIRLSGGERQRLAIARALLRKPYLLVLDEATSALDHDNELHIQTTLSKLHRHLTILLIAHRPATILCADQVISLQYGRVVKTDVPVKA